MCCVLPQVAMATIGSRQHPGLWVFSLDCWRTCPLLWCISLFHTLSSANKVDSSGEQILTKTSKGSGFQQSIMNWELLEAQIWQSNFLNRLSCRTLWQSTYIPPFTPLDVSEPQLLLCPLLPVSSMLWSPWWVSCGVSAVAPMKQTGQWDPMGQANLISLEKPKRIQNLIKVSLFVWQMWLQLEQVLLCSMSGLHSLFSLVIWCVCCCCFCSFYWHKHLFYCLCACFSGSIHSNNSGDVVCLCKGIRSKISSNICLDYILLFVVYVYFCVQCSGPCSFVLFSVRDCGNRLCKPSSGCQTWWSHICVLWTESQSI